MYSIPAPSILIPQNAVSVDKQDTRMSIRLEPGGLSFLLCLNDSHDFVHYRKYDLKYSGPEHFDVIQLIIKEMKDLYVPVSTEVITGLQDFVIIPDAFYLKEREAYFFPQSASFNNPIFLNNLISGAEAQLIYRLPLEIYDFLNNSFQKITFNHALAKLDQTLPQTKKDLNDYAVIRLSGNSFDFLAYSSGKMMLANIYSYITHSDFLYFLLLAMKAAQLDPQSSQLFLGGEIEQGSVIMNGIHKYVRNYSLIDSPISILHGEESDTPSHFFLAY
jgi:hypothetical protein